MELDAGATPERMRIRVNEGVNRMKKNALLMGLTAATLALAGSTFAWADDKPKEQIKEVQKQAEKEVKKQVDDTKKNMEKKLEKKDDKVAEKKGVAIGEMAPNFTLKDTNGKEHTLADFTKDGKIVVLQWFNPECPFVVKHYGKAGNTFNDLYANYNDKGVVIIGINSGAEGKQGAGLDKNQTYVKDWKIQYPILMDMNGAVGKQYDAKRTPEMFIIGKDGKVAYHGAIDNDRGTDKPGSENFVAKALDQIIAGQTVTNAETQPYGCSVKY
jgi:peroxiredoxin